MSTPKVGDRVHIEFDGVVTAAVADGALLVLANDACTPELTHVDWCTVLAPPVKVGDRVTEANIDQLVDGTVCARPGYAPTWKKHGRWHSPLAASHGENSLLNGPDDDLIVLRIGGAS